MKVDYINPFIESATEILRATTGMEVTRGKPSVDSGSFHAPEVCVVLGIIGDLSGQVIYGVSLPCALGIACKMMGEVEVKEMDELSRSAVAELGNMMAGNATSRFEKMSISMNISPPTVMIGQSVTIGWPLHRALVVPIEMEVGTMVVWVCLEESKA
jgi:chemotaxis protein CheX